MWLKLGLNRDFFADLLILICTKQIKVFISHSVTLRSMSKTKFTVEYDMQGAPVTLLWQYLFMPQGLELWFADEVQQEAKQFVFFWDGVPQQASLVSVRMGAYVRFHWKADGRERTFFEMRINVSELTDNKTLLITDFADSEDEVKEITELWNHSIEKLKRCIGCN